MASPPVENENPEMQQENVDGDGLVAAVDGMIEKLQKVSFSAARTNYVVTTFDGKTNDGENWMKQFERYARLQQLTEAQYADAFAFHVKGIALTWYDTLPDDIKLDWLALKDAFHTRFELSQQSRWRQERELYTLKQQLGQTVASFTADVLKAAGGLQLSEAQKVRVILGGLHSTVTPFVEQSCPQSVDDILKCPAGVNGMTPATHASTEEQIASVASLIEHRLLGQLTSVDAAHPKGSLRGEREDRSSERGRDHPERDYGATRSSWDRPERDYGPTGSSWDRPERDYGPTGSSWDRPERDYGPTGSKWDNTGRGRTTQQRPQRQPNCAYCGRWCAGNENCPAYVKRCYGCQQIGHFVSRCPNYKR